MSYRWERVTVSQVLSKAACNIGNVIVTPNGDSNNGNITLYNGESSGDPVIITVRTGTGRTGQVVMSPPLLCDRGLYVVLGSHVDECLIQFESLEDGARV
jgi:hypothetical protein